jgi:dihydrofolate reductase
MRRVFVSEFLTLDGVMQAPGGSDEDREEGFQHGGWEMPYLDDVGGQAVDRGLKATGGLLLGRTTYQHFASYWPNQPDDNPFAAVLNELPKYVASTTLEEPLAWSNSTLIKGNVAEGVARLKEEPGKDLQVIGSGRLAQTLMQHGLVDEYRLMIHPLVLGSGKRLFEEGVPKTPLQLVDSQVTGTGVLLVTYRPA